MIPSISFKKSFLTISHEIGRATLPLLAFILVSLDLTQAAYALVVIYKWRILAVKSRFWWANIRTNMVDILLGLAIVTFMDQTEIGLLFSGGWRLFWLAFYLTWVLYIKKSSSELGMTAQGILAFSLASTALQLNLLELSFSQLLLGIWVVSYFSSRHILSAYRQGLGPLLSTIFALFCVQLAWILWHWEVWYWSISQYVLISTVILTGLAIAYYLSRQDKPSSPAIKQVLITTAIMSLSVILLHNWRDTSL